MTTALVHRFFVQGTSTNKPAIHVATVPTMAYSRLPRERERTVKYVARYVLHRLSVSSLVPGDQPDIPRIGLHPAKIPEQRNQEQKRRAAKHFPHSLRLIQPVNTARSFYASSVITDDLLRVRQEQANEETKTLNGNERQVRGIANAAKFVAINIDCQRDRPANDVAKVAKAEPCSDISTSLVLLWIPGGDGSLNAPEKASTYSACYGADVYEPYVSESIVAVESSGVDRISQSSDGKSPAETDEVG